MTITEIQFYLNLANILLIVSLIQCQNFVFIVKIIFEKIDETFTPRIRKFALFVTENDDIF